ncbi:hypothetical protein PACTADRAFT_49273 [Pachysolen tannophilus NRRL Y-2460]|uniref:Rab-GAP TBC domain-containing protein n=1 Tax=Pachysolen tannophilus NRRL Y-2460 TaxID=669874 RepID=A0A1E4TVN1_PACTA|nr:hypothetical protein PACTADRAFT_49273 [Pachysolen tannophilus NRRL Y-2460]
MASSSSSSSNSGNNFNISQVSLQSLKEEDFTDVLFTEELDHHHHHHHQHQQQQHHNSIDAVRGGSPSAVKSYGKYSSRRSMSVQPPSASFSSQPRLGQVGPYGNNFSKSAVGLGINVSRRPSDSVLISLKNAKANGSVNGSGNGSGNESQSNIINNRPISTTSSLSSNSEEASSHNEDDEDGEEPNSRVSSMTSCNSTSSPFSSPANNVSNVRKTSLATASLPALATITDDDKNNNNRIQAAQQAAQQQQHLQKKEQLQLHDLSTPTKQQAPPTLKMSSVPNLRLSNNRKHHSLGLNRRASPSPSSSLLSVQSVQSGSQVTLTPTQKFRLRRQTSRLTLKDIEKNYDDYDSDDEIPNDSIVWNVPMAVGGTANFFANEKTCQSPNLINSMLNSNSVSMPPSPLPGSYFTRPPSIPASSSNSGGNVRNSSPFSPKLQKQPSFQNLSPTAREISSYYESSSTNYFQEELDRRNSNSHAMFQFQQANTQGLDDAKFLSGEKLQRLCSTRPIWLPPKDLKEVNKHEREISKVFAKAAEFELKSKELVKRNAEICALNKARFQDLFLRENIKKKHVHECGMMLFNTDIPNDIKFKMMIKLVKRLDSKFDLAAIISRFKELSSKQNIENISMENSLEIEKIFKQIEIHYPQFKDKNSNFYKKMMVFLKIDAICNDEEIQIYPFITSKLILTELYSNEEIFVLLKIFNHLTIGFANHDNSDLFAAHKVLSNSTIKKYLSVSKDDISLYQVEFETLTFINLLSILPLNLMIKFFDIFLILQDYKLGYALFLTIMRHYHFGFDSLSELVTKDLELDEVNVTNESKEGMEGKTRVKLEIDQDKFYDRMKYYYKKF